MGILDDAHQPRSPEWHLTGKAENAGPEISSYAPGPGTYRVPEHIFGTGGDAPSYSIGGDSTRFDHPRGGGPGPDAYGYAIPSGTDSDT